MGFLKYQMAETLKEFKRHPINHLLSTGAVTLAFLLVGIVFLMSGSLDYIGQKWSSGSTLVVYLKDGTQKSDITALSSDIKKLDGVKNIKFVSPQNSKTRLIKHLGDDATVIDKLEDNYFPVSLEVSIAGNVNRINNIKNKLYSLKDISPYVKDVKNIYSWNHNISHIVDILTIISMIIAMVIIFVAGYIIMSTAKMGVESKLDELKILKMLGSDNSFIETPVLIQGFIKGITAFTAAVLILYAISRFIYPMIELIFGDNFIPGGVPVFFSFHYMATGALIAGITGLLAGKVALSPLNSNG